MRSTFVLSVLLAFLTTLCVVECCNDKLCPSLVSRCQLIGACVCDMRDKSNCTCCQNCQLCLAKLYSECCSCVEMCPMPDPEDTIGRTNTIEELSDPIPELFNVLTEEEDSQQRWTIHSYPVYFESLYSKHMNKKENRHSHREEGGHSLSPEVNCTVAFMSKCMSAHKCKQSCKSMGAAKYRWTHHEGCCQCIGHTCIDYGLNEPMCLQCHGDDDDEMLKFENDVVADDSTIDNGVK